MTVNRQTFSKKDLPLFLEIEVDLGFLEIKVVKDFDMEWPTISVNFIPEETEDEDES